MKTVFICFWLIPRLHRSHSWGEVPLERTSSLDGFPALTVLWSLRYDHQRVKKRGEKNKTGDCTLPIILIITDDSHRVLFLERSSGRRVGWGMWGVGGGSFVALSSLLGYLLEGRWRWLAGEWEWVMLIGIGLILWGESGSLWPGNNVTPAGSVKVVWMLRGAAAAARGWIDPDRHSPLSHSGRNPNCHCALDSYCDMKNLFRTFSPLNVNVCNERSYFLSTWDISDSECKSL